MREAILKRISRRKYIKAPITAEKTEKLTEEIHRLNGLSGLSIEFLEDGADAFSSLTKTYGMFSGVLSLFVMKGRRGDKELAEKIGYYGEELVLAATELGLGTCWVAGTFDRRKITIPEDEEMLCVITVGEVAEPSGKEKLLRGRIAPNRKPARERLTGYDSAPEWAKEAMEAVRLAPSAVNTQKPMFHWDGERITADVGGHARIYVIDLGIAKRHFADVAGGEFRMGQGAEFIKNSDG